MPYIVTSKKICAKYNTNAQKDHIDLISEILWMADISRKQLGAMIGVHPWTIGKWVNRRCNIKQGKVKRAIEIVHLNEYANLKKIVLIEYTQYESERLKILCDIKMILF